MKLHKIHHLCDSMTNLLGLPNTIPTGSLVHRISCKWIGRLKLECCSLLDVKQRLAKYNSGI